MGDKNMFDRIKKIVVVFGLIGGLMSMGAVVGTFASIVRYWDQFVYITKVVNPNDVRYYHETLKPRVDEMWERR